jgi:L-ascorbate metabolism protein UlaG (beta-lactamase superfamily)
MRIERAEGFPAIGQPSLFWLGQAGFWIDTGQHRILIDPYLSNSLAEKYAGSRHPHIRLMAPPVEVEDLPRPDLVLISHAHTDHFDPGTLIPLIARFPDVLFIVPASRTDLVRMRLGLNVQLIEVDAGSMISPLPELEIIAFAAAHETLERDDRGRHLFLGYGITTSEMRIYHSGDCIPYPGLVEAVSEYAPQIALLPVNGRDARRLTDGIPGNFTLKEAIGLAQGANIPYVVAHHFGMFASNTVDPVEIDRVAANRQEKPVLLRPRAGERLDLLV